MQWKVFGTVILAGLVFAQIQAQNQNRNAYYEEMAGNLSNQVRLLQDENAKLAGNIHVLLQEIRQMKQQIRGLQEETAQLRRMISEESASRQKQLGRIGDKIQQAADAQSRAEAEARARAEAEARRAEAERNKNAAEQSQEEYDYYVVESGATLSAISRATGVSVSRLKQVNGLKNNVIRVGQKLKIPRK